MVKRSKKSKSRVFSVRLREAHYQTLKKQLGDMSIAEYIRRKVLLEAANDNEVSALPKDQVQQVAGVILGKLGHTGYAQDLKTVAKAVNQGAVVLSQDETLVVMQACDDIAEIRKRLIQLSGLRKAANDH